MKIAVCAVVVGLATVVGVAVAGTPVGGGGRIAFAADRRPILTRDSILAFAPGSRQPAVLATIPRGATLDPSGTRIAYTGGEGLIVARADGTNPRTVARNARDDGEPVWSPDGRSIAYVTLDFSECRPSSHGCAIFDLWVARADGTGTRKIAARARYPVWSADSRRLAFLGGYSTYDDAGRLWVAHADRGAARRLSARYGVAHYVWSPRSDRIAFEYRRRLRVVRATGGSATPIGAGLRSAWSPDGKRLAVVRGPSLAESVWIVTSSGRTLRRVGGARWVRELAWSRAGIAYLAVALRGDRSTALRVVGADGRGARTIVTLDRRTAADQLRWSGARVVLRASDGEGDRDLFTMAPDGSDVRRLTDDADYETQPTWAPDGRRVAFTSSFPRSNARWSLSVIDTGSGARTRITTPPVGSSDMFPAWSPTGETIAFTRVVARTFSQIWVVHADGTGATLLTPQLEGESSHPTWSPDGRRIAFTHALGPYAAVWSMNADGSELHEQATVGLAFPSWSPDGTRFAGLLGGRVVTVRTDGSDLRTVADDPTGTIAPRWSPDGAWLAYESADDVHLSFVDGRTTLDLTATPEPEQDPDWSGPGG